MTMTDEETKYATNEKLLSLLGLQGIPHITAVTIKMTPDKLPEVFVTKLINGDDVEHQQFKLVTCDE